MCICCVFNGAKYIFDIDLIKLCSVAFSPELCWDLGQSNAAVFFFVQPAVCFFCFFLFSLLVLGGGGGRGGIAEYVVKWSVGATDTRRGTGIGREILKFLGGILKVTFDGIFLTVVLYCSY